MRKILEEQKAYYRARASEYDEWFFRMGRYDHGEEQTRQWFAEVDQVREALLKRPRVEQALEFASGTGIWTAELLKIADRVTALDSSPEVQAIAREKMPDANVDYRLADLFAWEPDATYDLAFAGFWMSHVPPERLDDFLAKVAKAVKPGGTFFTVDSRNASTSSAKDHGDPDLVNKRHVRRLNDGREFEIVKVFYEPDVLAAALARHGFQATARFTDNYFIYAEATRHDG